MDLARTARLGAAAIMLVLPIAGTAAAEGLPVKAPIKVPILPWTGFYVGIHAGYGHDPAEGVFDPGTYGTTVAPTISLFSSPSPLNLKVNPVGWYGGAQAGFNQQIGSWVWGFEADVSYGAIKD